MNKEKNSYIVIYASVMVILVALALAFISQVLRPQQAKNEAIDKKRQMLTALNIESTNANAESLYEKYITDSYCVDVQGKKVDGDAFSIELAEELRQPESDRRYPVFEATVEGQKKYVLSMRGAGLWGPIWGFISFDDDRNTVYGASFGHEGETPGLGAEIEKPEFGKRFIGKHFFDSSGK
ncbi:MAG: FMN-binding protein, partial [Candidatus Symbiothrix sp.]|nr:FMN-binding protein [Candidatus Symbiothrix sp.]